MNLLFCLSQTMLNPCSDTSSLGKGSNRRKRLKNVSKTTDKHNNSLFDYYNFFGFYHKIPSFFYLNIWKAVWGTCHVLSWKRRCRWDRFLSKRKTTLFESDVDSGPAAERMLMVTDCFSSEKGVYLLFSTFIAILWGIYHRYTSINCWSKFHWLPFIEWI